MGKVDQIDIGEDSDMLLSCDGFPGSRNSNTIDTEANEKKMNRFIGTFLVRKPSSFYHRGIPRSVGFSFRRIGMM